MERACDANGIFVRCCQWRNEVNATPPENLLGSDTKINEKEGEGNCLAFVSIIRFRTKGGR